MGPRIREDNGRGSRGRAVPEPPLRGVGRTAYNGRPQGSPLRKDGGVGMAGWGTGDGSPHSRGQREGGVGGRAVPEPPLRGVGRTAYNGRPQGSPLQGRMAGWGKGNGSPHSRGQREGESGGGGGARFPNRPYEGLVAQHITGDHKGRPYGRNGRGRGMGPRMREDNGRGSRGRAVPEPPLRGVGRTAYNGRPQGSPLRKDGRGRGMGPRIREDNGRGSRGAGGSRTAPTRGWSHSI